MRIIYLHGFASGPSSRKAQVFRARFEAAGVPVTIPSLDAGNFFELTISGQYDVLSREANRDSVVLMGSSMGGYLAALYAARHPEVQKLVLLAPAFGFKDRWPAMLGPEKFNEWRQTGELEVFHYADQAPRKVSWRLAADAEQWESVPTFTQPALIFHGINDTVVPIASSQVFAAAHSNIRLESFDAGHELTEVIDEMWVRTADFLGIARQ
ncbi:MAG: alpha/beta fold hydrolase [Acidobacteria bacterium]|nr:alpha/beta fold hydrolase [Acidobacteriota bacterium]